MNKIATIIVIAFFAVGAWLLWRDAGSSEVVVPAAPVAPVVDVQPAINPVADIDADIQAIDVGSSNADLQAVDADINGL